MAMMQQAGQTIQEAAQAVMVEDIGTFTCTAYAYTGSPCANGDMPTTGHTIACNSLPFGTKLKIEGLDGIYEVEDRGASWHSDRWLDIYMGDVETCMNWGKQEREVYIIHGGQE